MDGQLLRFSSVASGASARHDRPIHRLPAHDLVARQSGNHCISGQRKILNSRRASDSGNGSAFGRLAVLVYDGDDNPHHEGVIQGLTKRNRWPRGVFSSMACVHLQQRSFSST
jgi:hypothetical protein